MELLRVRLYKEAQRWMPLILHSLHRAPVYCLVVRTLTRQEVYRRTCIEMHPLLLPPCQPWPRKAVRILCLDHQVEEYDRTFKPDQCSDVSCLVLTPTSPPQLLINLFLATLDRLLPLLIPGTILINRVLLILSPRLLPVDRSPCNPSWSDQQRSRTPLDLLRIIHHRLRPRGQTTQRTWDLAVKLQIPNLIADHLGSAIPSLLIASQPLRVAQ